MTEPIIKTEHLTFRYTTGLAPSVLTYILQTVVGGKYGGHTVSDELGLPVTQSGLALPCGATGRWTSKR